MVTYIQPHLIPHHILRGVIGLAKIDPACPASLRGIFEAKSALLRGEGHHLRCATLCRASLRYGGAWE